MKSVTAHEFFDDGTFPNNGRLPLLHYVNSVKPDPEEIEKLFISNGWDQDPWRDIVYPFHHYHTTAHEVLGAFKGWALVRFGGEKPGRLDVRFAAGDVVVIPAGVAHKCLEKSDDFACVGSYPTGQIVDMNTGEKGERPAADERIAKLPLPERDPVQGAGGVLNQLWQAEDAHKEKKSTGAKK